MVQLCEVDFGRKRNGLLEITIVVTVRPCFRFSLINVPENRSMAVLHIPTRFTQKASVKSAAEQTRFSVCCFVGKESGQTQLHQSNLLLAALPLAVSSYAFVF